MADARQTRTSAKVQTRILAASLALCNALQGIEKIQKARQFGWDEFSSMMLEWKECVEMSGVLVPMREQVDREIVKTIWELYMVAQAVGMVQATNFGGKISSGERGEFYLGEIETPGPEELRRKSIGLEEGVSGDPSGSSQRTPIVGYTGKGQCFI